MYSTFIDFIFFFFHILQTEKLEQEIIKLLMGALKLCDTDTTSDRQILYAFRTGLLYHRLANLYNASYWRTVAGGFAPCEDDQDSDGEARRKKLLQLSRLYYEKSIKQFEQLGEPKEYLQVQCDRLTFQNRLAEGNFIKKKNRTDFSF